jgi:hypothetical protein
MLIKYAESQLFYSAILNVNAKKYRPKSFRVLENQTLTINFKIWILKNSNLRILKISD